MALVIASHSAAQICKWVDEDGVTHYAEKCPEEVNGQEVKIDSGPSETDVELARQRSEQSREGLEARKKERETLESEQRDSEQRGRRAAEAIEQMGYVPIESFDIDCSSLLTTHSWLELDQACENAREKRLKPEREKLINKCKSSKNNDPEWCERIWLQYGAGRPTSAGYQANKYDWLPECVTARKCQQQSK